MEQRNGRIGRKLQPAEVRCMYFTHPQREDRALAVLVKKIARIRRRLGSLSAVVMERLHQVLEDEGINETIETALDERIVIRTFEPLLAAMGGEPSSAQLLALEVCDPAMGSGAFLVSACRFLGDQLVAAWTPENRLHDIVAAHDDPVMHARRVVAMPVRRRQEPRRWATYSSFRCKRGNNWWLGHPSTQK